MSPLLEVRELKTYFFTFGGRRVVKAVDGLSFSLDRGESLALVGESGCGKTTACLSILRLLPPAGRIVGGEVLFEGRSLLAKPDRVVRSVRGKKVSMIPQDPMVSLDPVFTVGEQIAEPLRTHRKLRGQGLGERIEELLHSVGIPDPPMRVRQYPHEMSGGMRQRVVGAIALAGGPGLLIGDEPTTNLDVTVQAQYLDMLQGIQQKTGLALLLVTHNLGIVAKMCQGVVVMYAGKAVERAPVGEIFHHPAHPYTRALLRAIPRLGSKEPLVSIPGQPPDLSDLPPGCSFSPRCSQREARCQEEEPPELPLSASRFVKCWLLAG